MDSSRNFLNSFWGANCVQIYAIALMLVFLKIVFKYITKMDILKISAKTDAATKKSLHFECLRVGVDLVVLGIVTFLSIIRLAFSLAQTLDQSSQHPVLRQRHDRSSKFLSFINVYEFSVEP